MLQTIQMADSPIKGLFTWKEGNPPRRVIRQPFFTCARVIPKAKPRKPEAIASKSTPLNSQFVLYSLIYLRSSSTVSGVHGNFVAVALSLEPSFLVKNFAY